MIRRRPILAACLIVAVFATGGLGIAGGRVICVGAEGHLAVAGAHDGAQQHDCCCENQADDHEQAPSLVSGADCSDWSLDAQHAPRTAGDGDTVQATDFAPIAPVMLAGNEFCNPSSIRPSPRFGAAFAQIPRAHLAPLSTTILLI
jgi:hypothetical protein